MGRSERFLEQARQFRALGDMLSRYGEGWREKLWGAIAVGFAEVCELLAEVADELEREK